MLRVEPLGDPREAEPSGVQLEDAPDDRSLGRIDPPEHMEALRVSIGTWGRREHLDVVVAVDDPAGDVERLRLLERRVDRALAVLEIEEDADPRIDDRLQSVCGLDLLATEGGITRRCVNSRRVTYPSG